MSNENIGEAFLEFQREEELGPSARLVVSQDTIELFGELNEKSKRQNLYTLQREYLTKITPNTHNAIGRLSVAFMWQASKRITKKALSETASEREQANALQENIAKYFKLGGHYGTLAFRLQAIEDGLDTSQPADLPNFWLEEIDKAPHDSMAEFFNYITSADEHSTWQLSHFLEQTPINYAKPLKKTRKALILGSQTAFQLHTAAAWHGSGQNHPFNAQLSTPKSSATSQEVQLYFAKKRAKLYSKYSRSREY